MKVLVVFFTILVISNAGKSPHGEKTLRDFTSMKMYIPKSVRDDATLDVVEIIKKYGYPIEEHRLQTEDKYSVTLFHIPHGINNDTKCIERKPIFLMHGLYGSSSTWIIQGPGKSLAYILAEECFDVWLGNARGTSISRGSSELWPGFWDFSFHQIGYYDVPRMIDFILRFTGEKKLHCLGHSQGTTAFFVMASTRPEYNDKLLSLTALAPIAYTDHIPNPVIQSVCYFAEHKDVFDYFIGNGEFIPSYQWMKTNAKDFCEEEQSYFPLCTNFIFQLSGFDPEAINMTLLPVYMGHEPGGGSANEILHHVQNMKSEKFRYFDHGVMENILEYDSIEPPSYNLKKITAPTSLIYSDEDSIATKRNVIRLSMEISNLHSLTGVRYHPFNHMDFLYRINAKEIIYDYVIALIKSYK